MPFNKRLKTANPLSRSGTARINNGTANAIHVAFKKEILLTAINQFSVNNDSPGGSLVTYKKEAQERMNSK